MSLPDESWMANAACRGRDPALFFTNKRATARRICARCPVRNQCETYALDARLPGLAVNGRDRPLLGIWAGTTKTDRAKLRRKLAKQKAPA